MKLLIFAILSACGSYIIWRRMREDDLKKRDIAEGDDQHHNTCAGCKFFLEERGYCRRDGIRIKPDYHACIYFKGKEEADGEDRR